MKLLDFHVANWFEKPCVSKMSNNWAAVYPDFIAALVIPKQKRESANVQFTDKRAYFALNYLQSKLQKILKHLFEA